MRWFLKALHSAAVEDYDDESVCRGKSIFGGSCSNLTSIFRSCAHFIDWPVGCVGSLLGKVGGNMKKKK